MKNIITFIIAKDENNQNVLMDVEIDKNMHVISLNIAGYVFNHNILENLKPRLEVDEDLFNAMSNNEPMDLTSKFAGLSKDEILAQIKNNVAGGGLL